MITICVVEIYRMVRAQSYTLCIARGGYLEEMHGTESDTRN